MADGAVVTVAIAMMTTAGRCRRCETDGQRGERERERGNDPDRADALAGPHEKFNRTTVHLFRRVAWTADRVCAPGSVTSVNFSRVPSAVAIAACAASLAVTLSACGSDEKKPEAGAPSSTEATEPSLPNAVTPMSTDTPAAASCPTAPASGGAPDMTIQGTTGSVAVVGPTDAAAPSVTVNGPFSVTETQVHTIKAGTGPVVSPTASVYVCYAGFDGRDGHKFDSAFDRGEPAQFSLTGVVPGFQKAIAGQKVGSTVAVAMAPADGYPDGQPSAHIAPGDSLVFAIKILDAAN